MGELTTILYDALYRELNPQTGVWLQVDPKIEMNMENWSPYASNFNNPIRFKDPKGDCPTCEEVWKEVKYSVKSTLVSTFDNAVTVAREINQFNPLASLVEVITGTSSQSDFTQEKPRSMAVADFGVNSLMLFGSAPLRGMSIVNRGLNGSRALNVSAEAVASNGNSRFIADGVGNVIDTKIFQGLKEVNVLSKGARGATKTPLFGKPGTFANLGNGHKIVYGADGRALFDVSTNRIKGIKWNVNSEGKWFPQKGAETKFEGPVPEVILKALGF